MREFLKHMTTGEAGLFTIGLFVVAFVGVGFYIGLDDPLNKPPLTFGRVARMALGLVLFMPATALIPSTWIWQLR